MKIFIDEGTPVDPHGESVTVKWDNFITRSVLRLAAKQKFHVGNYKNETVMARFNQKRVICVELFYFSNGGRFV